MNNTTNLTWNLVEKVGLPKEDGVYYVTYNDYEYDHESTPIATPAVTVSAVKIEGGEPFFDSCQILELEDVLAWAKIDIRVPKPYIPKKEKEEEKKDSTLEEYIKTEASTEDIVKIINGFLIEYLVKVEKEDIGTFFKLPIIAEYSIEVEKALKKPFKESIFYKAWMN